MVRTVCLQNVWNYLSRSRNIVILVVNAFVLITKEMLTAIASWDMIF